MRHWGIGLGVVLLAAAAWFFLRPDPVEAALRDLRSIPLGTTRADFDARTRKYGFALCESGGPPYPRLGPHGERVADPEYCSFRDHDLGYTAAWNAQQRLTFLLVYKTNPRR